MIFRYPGAKTKLLPLLQPHLNKILDNRNEFYDIFVGGGSVSIYMAKNFPYLKIHVNDSDENIYSFWKLISLNKEYNLFNDLLKQKPTIELFKKNREYLPQSLEEKAYHAIFFNRTTFSGISTSGPIGGEGQKSKWKIDCRYNINKIFNDIKYLKNLFSNRLTVTNLNFSSIVKKVDSPMYLDPPYYIKGKILYKEKMSISEHELLSSFLLSKKNWVLSYDICKEIDTLYHWANKIKIKTLYTIKGKKYSLPKREEYIILPN